MESRKGHPHLPTHQIKPAQIGTCLQMTDYDCVGPTILEVKNGGCHLENKLLALTSNDFKHKIRLYSELQKAVLMVGLC